MVFSSELNLNEQQDFSYILQLMMPLYDEKEYACLPELFTILDYKKVIELCKYAGGETIKIPTLEELSVAIESLQWFYDVFIANNKSYQDIPQEYRDKVLKIKKVYNSRDKLEMVENNNKWGISNETI